MLQHLIVSWRQNNRKLNHKMLQQIKFLAKQEKSLKSLINKAGKMIDEKVLFIIYSGI